MIEVTPALQGASGAAILLTLSFVSLLAGLVLRKWPGVVRERAMGIDGSALFFTPETYRTLTRLSGTTLVSLSFASLLALGWVL